MTIRGDARTAQKSVTGQLKGEAGANKFTIRLSDAELKKLDRLAQREIKASRSMAIARLIREASDGDA